MPEPDWMSSVRPWVAGPPDQMPAAAGRGHLRASHADRERVVGSLKAAFVQGRLAKDEFDLRVGQALAALTYAELAAVIADLPAGPAGATPSQPVRAHEEQPVRAHEEQPVRAHEEQPVRAHEEQPVWAHEE